MFASIKFPCPACGKRLSAPVDCAGRKSRCKCGVVVEVPTLPVAELALPSPPPGNDTAGASRAKWRCSKRTAAILLGILALGLIGFRVLQSTVLVDSSIDAIDIYEAFVANPDAAKARFGGLEITVRGVVHNTAVTGHGAVVFLWHRRDAQRHRFAQRNIRVDFHAGEHWDKGFDFQFTNDGRVILPWSAGDTVRFQAIIGWDGTTLYLIRAKLL
jgi:hypothetical protein